VRNTYRKNERAANTILKLYGCDVKSAGNITGQATRVCARCGEVGSTNTKRLETPTYIPSFKLPQIVAAQAKEAVGRGKGVVNAATGDVKIYETTLKELMPKFQAAAAQGITYQPAKLKTTMGTLTDATAFKKRNANGGNDNGEYATTMAKSLDMKAVWGCDPACMQCRSAGGLLQQPQWATISRVRGCQRNGENIRYTRYQRVANLQQCQALCQAGCAAVDFFETSRYCLFYAKACTNPLANWNKASSYRKTTTAQATTGPTSGSAPLRPSVHKDQAGTCVNYCSQGQCVYQAGGTDCTGCAALFSNGAAAALMSPAVTATAATAGGGNANNGRRRRRGGLVELDAESLIEELEEDGRAGTASLQQEIVQNALVDFMNAHSEEGLQRKHLRIALSELEELESEERDAED